MSRRWKILLLIILGVTVAIALVYIDMLSPRIVTVKSDEYGTVTIQYRNIVYDSGDAVWLEVSAKDEDAVALKTVRLYSEIEGLENVTLFSEGQAYWDDTIYRDNIDHYDTKEFEFTLPEYAESMGKVNIVVFVEFVYASGFPLFHNEVDDRELTITLTIE
jgi:hypothetical protein